MAAGYFDFSVGAVTAAASVVAASALSGFGLPLPLAVLAAVAGGLAIGLVLGVLVAVLDTVPGRQLRPSPGADPARRSSGEA